jgi:hypothetical protein
LAFFEDGSERDMAVLLRSVKAKAEQIIHTLRAYGIPFVVTGMTNLSAPLKPRQRASEAVRCGK